MDEYEYESDDPEVKEVEENIKWNLANADKPEYRAHLIAQGKDPDEVIAWYRKTDAEFRAVKRRCSKIMEAAEEAELQALANQADAELALYKATLEFYRQQKEINPFDPRLENLEAQLEVWRKQFPKDIE